MTAGPGPVYYSTMKNPTMRMSYANRIDPARMKKLKVLAALLDKRQNDLLEEAIDDLMSKYAVREDIAEFQLKPAPPPKTTRKK